MIRDSDFLTKSKVPGPTKEEIRCLVLCKSQVNSKDIVVDIGSGTGGLTLEFAKRASKVYSVDKNVEAINLTTQNLEKFGLTSKVTLLTGNATNVLDNLPPFNLLFIGGSGGELSALIKKGYSKLKIDGRIMVTAILLETATEAIETLKNLGMDVDVVNVSISKAKILERGTMMKANNPITIISGLKMN